jgi:hypothetical protein
VHVRVRSERGCGEGGDVYDTLMESVSDTVEPSGHVEGDKGCTGVFKFIMNRESES